MQEKKDRRSKRDKLKDTIISDIGNRIKYMEQVCGERKRLNQMDEQIIGILKDQLATIDVLCKEEEGEVKKP